MSTSLEIIGNKWSEDKLSLSQMYMAGRLCEEVIETYIPETSNSRIDNPKMAIVVLEDGHLLGKRIVCSMLRASGYKILDYGCQHIDEILDNVIKDKLDILFVSVLMYSSALKIKQLVTRLRERCCKAKVMVGGAPFRFDKNLWKEISADAMGYNSSDAIKYISDFRCRKG